MNTNRFRSRVMVSFVLLAVFATGGAEATVIEESLLRLQQSPPSDPDCFDFAVLGDSNTLKPLEQSDVFRRSLQEFNILKPNFVVEVGDIVLGGAAEGVPAQWDLFEQVIKTCEVPYVAAPGNHDISDAATEKLWRERMGPTFYSFRYGNSQFVLLNSEEVGAVDRISDEQVAWLKKELESSTAKNIFLFLHQHYFEHADDPAAPPEQYWGKHWANVAAVLQGHPVRAVFCGHEHVYRDCGVRDGVHYVITGGAATYGMQGPENEGHFNHYLLVSVRGEEVHWAVIKPSSVLPEDVVTSARIDELNNIRNTWIAADEVFTPLGAPVDQDVTITISNPAESSMKSSLKWDLKPGWTIEPTEAAYEVATKSATKLLFRVKTATAQDARFPVPIFHTTYSQTQHGPAVDVAQDLRFVPVMAAARAQGPIKIDGVLDEWAAAPMAPMIYSSGFDGKDTSDLQCRLGFLWDDNMLYLAVETVDNEYYQPYAGDIVWSADNVELFLNDWSWGLTLTKNGPEVFLYEGVNVSAETVNTDVKLAVKRDGTKIIYEAAFPKSHLTPLELAQGNSFRFNLLMNDLDPSGPVKPRHWLELVPGPSAPGSRPPRVKVVLR